jgi:ferritin
MLSKNVQDALNDQINAELGSAYLYLSMSAWFEAENLQGSGKWMRRQAREEVAHAMRLFDFVNDCNGRVTLKAVEGPQADFKSVLAVWETTLKQEEGVTARIHALCSLALKEDDFRTQGMLQWFVNEQIEEEKTATTILEQVKRIGPSSSAIFFLDRHLGKEAEEKE